MRLTERKAITISMELWKFLSENQGATKTDFPMFQEYKLDSMVAACSCCEYISRIGTWDCKQCPIKDCLKTNSVFERWANLQEVKCEEGTKLARLIYLRLKRYHDKKWGKK